MNISLRSLKLFGLFLGLMLVVPLISSTIVYLNEPVIRTTAFEDLSVIAKLKAGQIESWLSERQIDAEFLAADEGFATHAERLILTGNTDSRVFVVRRLETYSKSKYYNAATLLNTSGQLMAATGDPDDAGDVVTRQLFQAILKSGRIMRGDLYRDGSSGLIHFDMLLPLRGSGGQQAVGALLFSIPAEKFLFPLIQTWPTSSPSAETLLVRHDGEDVLFLNESRHRRGTALSLRFPLDTPNLPSAVAVRAGKAQFSEGTDYRGVGVFFATHPVAGTPWHVVAKVDREEVMEPLNKLVFWVGLVTLLAVAAIGIAIWRLGRQMQYTQQMELATQNMAIQRESEVRYRRLYEGMMDAFVLVDMSGRLLDFNQAYQEMLGYSDEELRSKTYADLTPEKWRELEARIVEEQIHPHGQSDVYEKEYIRKDGTVIPVELRCFLMRKQDGQPYSMWAIVRDISARRKAENELRIAARVLESQDGMAVTDANRLILRVNAAFTNITGYAAEEVIGKSPCILKSGRHGPDFYRNMWESINNTGGWDGEIWNQRNNGEVYPVHLTITAVKDPNAIVTNYVAIFRDITNRKLAEERICRTTEQQTLLLQLLEITLGDGSFEETLQGCLEKILAISWLGVKPKGLIFLVSDEEGRRLQMAASCNLQSEIQTRCANIAFGYCLCGRAAASGEIQFANQVDERCEINLPSIGDHGHYCLPLVADGQVVGVLGLYLAQGTVRDENNERFLRSVADILAGYVSRKIGEQALIDHQAHLEEVVQKRTADLIANQKRTLAIVTAMLDCVVHINAYGIILFVNESVQDMFGYTSDELIGRNVSILMPESYATQHDGYITRFLRAREAHCVGTRKEAVGRRKDGSLYPIEITVNEIVDDEGCTFIGVIRDLTAQKTAEITIRNALQVAQAATEAKSSFLANMSHEIRTPLNAILGLAKIGVRDNHGRKSRENYLRIQQSGQHLLGVINDILDFSKIEAGKLKIEKRLFALSPIIDDVIGFVADRAATKALALSVSVAPDMPDWVDGDALRLTQILSNLLANAVKFTERGEVAMQIAREGEDIYFMVRDTGIGMSEVQMDRLFQPFEQADSSTTRTYGGTGLGLAISRNLAQMMDGDIYVDCHPGAGCSFCLRLHLPAAIAPEHLGRDQTNGTTSGARLAGLSILAVDDVEVNRLILEDLLIHEGAHVVLANDGRQALGRLEENGVSSFDAVLMDVQMPEMDGFEAARRIAEVAPSLPVIGLTAHALIEERDKCLTAGMVDHVTKPIDEDILVSAILRHTQSGTSVPGVTVSAVSVISAIGTLTTFGQRPTEPSLAKTDSPDAGVCTFSAGIVDWPALVARFKGNKTFVHKLVASVLQSHGESPAKLRDAVEKYDLESLAFLAHSIKGASGNLMAEETRRLASVAEMAAREGRADAAELAVQLARCVENLLTELGRLCKQCDGSL